MNHLPGATILNGNAASLNTISTGESVTRIRVYLALLVLIVFTLVMNAHYLGFAPAMFRKGNMYFFGNVGHPQDFVKAVEWFTKSAEAGYPKAQNNLGLIYLDGRPGVPADIKLAHKYLKMAAENEYQPGMHNFARCLLRDNNPERDEKKAFYYYLAAAERHFPPSMGEAGRCYELGIGVASDSIKARQWYENGSRWGDQLSCQRYGQLLFDGTGVTQDKARGLALLILGGDPIQVKAAREQADDQTRRQATVIYQKLREELDALEREG